MLKQKIATALLIVSLAGIAQAAKIDPTTVKKGDTGPEGPFGETPAETANKKVLFDMVYTMMVERKPREAFEKYVSKDYCNHGHLATRMERECSTYEEQLSRWEKEYGKPLTKGEKIEMPNMATVNGEMVTMFGEGIDIFRVHNGKITDHWDASPPAAFSSAPPPKGQRPDDPTVKQPQQKANSSKSK
ncbi:MAG: hypothetical protein QM808_03940 [Steroidobacteraceae bacterium]